MKQLSQNLRTGKLSIDEAPAPMVQAKHERFLQYYTLEHWAIKLACMFREVHTETD